MAQNIVGITGSGEIGILYINYNYPEDIAAETKRRLILDGWTIANVHITRPTTFGVYFNISAWVDTAYSATAIKTRIKLILDKFLYNVSNIVVTGVITRTPNPNEILPSTFNTNTDTNANTGTYTVQAGDTLSKIAAKHKTTWQALAQLNGLTGSAVNQLRVGQVLKVSGSENLQASIGGNISNIPSRVITTADVSQVISNINNQTVKPKDENWYDGISNALGVGVPILAITGILIGVILLKPQK